MVPELVSRSDGRLPYLLTILVLLGAPLVLVFIQPDFGMTITYVLGGGAIWFLACGIVIWPC